jgi:hypothetical protein
MGEGYRKGICRRSEERKDKEEEDTLELGNPVSSGLVVPGKNNGSYPQFQSRNGEP